MNAATHLLQLGRGVAENAGAFAEPPLAVVGPGEAAHYGLVAGAVVLLVACVLRQRSCKW
jgi:hypothetical protein